MDFEKLAEQQRLDNRISIIKQKLEVGDRVRCYNADDKSLCSFVGYANITEILIKEENFCWCLNTDKNHFINYFFYVIKPVE